MDLVNRLRYFMENLRIPISQFADTCGIPRPTMSQLMNGRNKRVSDEIINKIHNGYPSLSILWLMFGEGEMETASNTAISEPKNDVSEPSPASQLTNNQNITNPKENLETTSFRTPENSDFGNSLFDDVSMDAGAQGNPQTAGTTNAQTYSSPQKPISQRGPATEQSSPVNISFEAGTTMTDTTQQPPAKCISIAPDARKKITNIVVFYSDNSFQSFLPES